MYPQYMCILLYVIVIWCNVFQTSISIGVGGGGGIDVSSVYVHSADMCTLL